MDFWRGFLIGVLIGEGHFGGDGKQPHVVVRLHSRHLATLERLATLVPGSRIYGPYFHAGRDYCQWMARGPVLRERLLPILNAHVGAFDDHARQRYLAMLERYGLPPLPADDVPVPIAPLFDPS